MESSLYVATAAQRSLSKQLDTLANNVANSNTIGFRAESIDFNALVMNSGSSSVHFPVVAGIHPSSEQGTHIETGNPLDVALSGDGWFGIVTPAGTAYTRDGRLQLSPFGELQTIEGHPILDSGGAPIQLADSTIVPTISGDGRILANGKFIGEIGVFEIDSQNLSARYGNSAFFALQPGTPLALGSETKLNQGFLESSNVNPMKELASLISITRNFESASSMIERADNVLAKSIGELAKRRG